MAKKKAVKMSGAPKSAPRAKTRKHQSHRHAESNISIDRGDYWIEGMNPSFYIPKKGGPGTFGGLLTGTSSVMEH
jgi:hypothetical protein